MYGQATSVDLARWSTFGTSSVAGLKRPVDGAEDTLPNPRRSSILHQIVTIPDYADHAYEHRPPPPAS